MVEPDLVFIKGRTIAFGMRHSCDNEAARVSQRPSPKSRSLPVGGEKLETQRSNRAIAAQDSGFRRDCSHAHSEGHKRWQWRNAV
jgi:hypothetical protein